MRSFLDRVGTSAGAEFAERSVHVLCELTTADLCWLTLDGSTVAERRLPGADPLPAETPPPPARGSEAKLQAGRWFVHTALRDASGIRMGALHVRLRSVAEPPEGVGEFLDTVGELLSGRLQEQQQVEQMRERLRVEQSTARAGVEQGLDDLLDRPSLLALRPDIEAAVLGDAPVLILGESGTGKTKLADAIARASGRTPIVRATLGASDDLNTITSELFGHLRGAFSGAVGARKGLVEYADGGTLILDEILNLPPHAQQLLLDFTQFGTYRPLGYQGREPKVASVRIIAATNGNMRRAIEDTRFRQDLYFRLASIPISLPSLRECRDEIPDVATRYLQRLDHRGWELSPEAARLLRSESLDWAGNIRELEGMLQRAVHRARVADGEAARLLKPPHFGLEDRPLSNPPAGEVRPPSDPPERDATLSERWTAMCADRDVLEARERQILIDAMVTTGGVQSRAARLLGIPRTTLLSRLNRLGIDKDQFRHDLRVSKLPGG